MYNVEVFKKTDNNLTLKTPHEIAESIKAYLRAKAAGINTKITQENNTA